MTRRLRACCATTLVLLRKDLLIEWRTRARLNALIFFAIATLLLFSFALGPDTKLLERNAGGYLWLAILFASVLSLGESFRVETRTPAWTACGSPRRTRAPSSCPRRVGNALLLLAWRLVLVPVMVALYGVRSSPGSVTWRAPGPGLPGAQRPGDRLCGHRQQRPRPGCAAASAIVPARHPGPALRRQGDLVVSRETRCISWAHGSGCCGVQSDLLGLGFVLFPRVIED